MRSKRDGSGICAMSIGQSRAIKLHLSQCSPLSVLDVDHGKRSGGSRGRPPKTVDERGIRAESTDAM